jgi:hypothetical protein
MDPEGNGVTMNEGAEGAWPAQRGVRLAVSSQQWKRLDVHRKARRTRGGARCDIKTSLCTEYVSLYISTYSNFNDCNREQCLIQFSVSGE